MVKNQSKSRFLKETTYSKEEIKRFLGSEGLMVASVWWFNDIKSENPTYTEVADWFSRYFGPDICQNMLRLMESQCIGYTEFAEQDLFQEAKLMAMA